MRIDRAGGILPVDDQNRMVEDLWALLDFEDLKYVDFIDSERLAIERERLPARRRDMLKSPTYSLKNRFYMWESLIRKMESEWRPSRYYLVDEYLNDLTSRSMLSEISASAPSGIREKIEETLSALDQRFFDQTIDDRGTELGRWRSEKLPAVIGFLWDRRPITLPW